MGRPGLAPILAGTAVLLICGGGFDDLSAGLVADGWEVRISVIVGRTRYHKQRMAEPSGSDEGGSGEGWAF